MHYYPFHIGDFRSGTVNMSRQARWIYRDMMDIYYDTEQPLPLDLDQLFDMLGAESGDEKSIVERHLKFKFDKSDDGYRHEICDKTIAEYHAKAVTARENGKLGGRPKHSKNKPSGFPSGSNPVPSPNPDLTGSEANQEPITNNQKNSSNEEFSLPQTPSQAEGAAESADEDYPIEFEQFWQTYPRKTGKRKAFEAWRKARRKTNNTFLIAKASRYAADPNREPGYTLTPANWLDGEHWDDDPLPAKPEPTARPSPSAWNRSQANQDANAALIAHYAAEEAAENQSREGVLTC